MKTRLLLAFLIFCLSFYISACTSSKPVEEETGNEPTEVSTETEESAGLAIINTAKEEQQKEFYDKKEDSTYLYWLNNKLILLNNQTKCNIFALNVLFKAGFKTPKVNTLTKDLVDTSRFKDIFPVVGISSTDAAMTGDLIVWNGHVIIFESLVETKKDVYVQAWWAGTRQADNGDNIINNVCYGKYKLSGYYVVRRPVKK